MHSAVNKAIQLILSADAELCNILSVTARMSLASSLIALLIGVPLGIQSQRRESTIGMAIALVTALCYYLVVILMMSLSKNYHVHPEILIWLPPLACGGLACYLIPKNL